MRAYPGEVYFLPPDAKEDGDPKTRRHPLLTPCHEDTDVVLFSYASREETEAEKDGPHIFLEPHLHEGCGFTSDTYLYPLRIVPVSPEYILRRTGALSEDLMRSLRACLSQALGIGTGTALGFGRARGSWRGRIVRMAAAITQENNAEWGLIISDPRYSFRKRYQNVVPIYPYTMEELPGDVVVEEAEWLKDIGMADTGAILEVTSVFGLWHETEIRDRGGVLVIDHSTMDQVELALCSLFDL
jgi:hypothetical protein